MFVFDKKYAEPISTNVKTNCKHRGKRASLVTEDKNDPMKITEQTQKEIEEYLSKYTDDELEKMFARVTPLSPTELK